MTKSVISALTKIAHFRERSFILNERSVNKTKSSPPYKGGVAAASADGVVLSFFFAKLAA
jgi:hypothetical protein